MAAKKKAPVKKAPAKKAAVKKKVAAKKAPAKKAAVKKSPAKKVAAKKAPAKKAATKKAAVKKSPVKKSAVKKSPAKKVAAKKAPAKKSTARKAPAKKVVSSQVSTSSSVSSVALLERPQTFAPAPVATTAPAISKPAAAKPAVPTPAKTETKSPRKVFFLLVPLIALLGFVVVSNSSSEVATETPKEEVTASPTPTESEVELILEAPVSVFADYTPTGGKITWQAPANGADIQNYLVQAAYAGGEFATIATVDAATLSYEVTKVDTPSFTTFRVVAVYPSGEATSDISEIKGKYEAQS